MAQRLLSQKENKCFVQNISNSEEEKELYDCLSALRIVSMNDDNMMKIYEILERVSIPYNLSFSFQLTPPIMCHG